MGARSSHGAPGCSRAEGGGANEMVAHGLDGGGRGGLRHCDGGGSCRTGARQREDGCSGLPPGILVKMEAWGSAVRARARVHVKGKRRLVWGRLGFL